MLRTLHVRDFVIVDQATIDFDSGFTVFFRRDRRW